MKHPEEYIPENINDANTFLWLYKKDEEEALQYYHKPCPFCRKGKLYSSKYFRKCTGLTITLEKTILESCPDFHKVHSYVCSSCRKRFTPLPSRFAGKRRFLSALHTIFSIYAFTHGPAVALTHFRQFTSSITANTLRHWKKR